MPKIIGTTRPAPIIPTARAASARPNCDAIADGQHGDVGPVDVADQHHVAEDVGRSDEVDLRPAGELDHVAARFTRVSDFVVEDHNVRRVSRRTWPRAE